MRKFLWLPVLVALGACSDSSPPPPPQAATQPTPTVLDDQLEAMEKAKAVEAQNAERKRKLDEQLDGG